MRFSFKLPYFGKRTVIKLGALTVVTAVGQGIWYRYQFDTSPSLPPPAGPTTGVERFIGKVKKAGQDFQDSALYSKIKKISLLFNDVGSGTSDSQKSTANSKKSYKLLILGDSLVRGIGCDYNSQEKMSPVLPRVLAGVLSSALKADIVWRAEGIVGGTVTDMESLFLPLVKDEFQSNEPHVEYIVILICGLNDWKSLLIHFPWGKGPNTFREDLKRFLESIRVAAGENNRKIHLYLPALPILCGESDPNFILQRRPMKFFVDAITWTWDLQKKIIAEDISQVEELIWCT